MPVLRWLRIFVPLLLVAVLVAGTVLVLTSRSDLQKSRQRVADAWEQLQPALNSRYGALHAANDAVKGTPGPLNNIVREVASDYSHWRDLEAHPQSVADDVEAANALEAAGRRLVVAAHKAPRLDGNEEVLGQVDAFAERRVPEQAAAFNELVGKFQDLRARPSYTLAARILGYDEIPDLDTGGGAAQ
jgi:hypothetical protein